MPPIGDEAYYWMWGQKPAWSYLDHPPLHAWLLHIVGLVLGWNLFSLRALTWLTLAGTLWIMWLWAKRLRPNDPGAWFWPTAAIYLASPLFFIMSAISFHDHLLIFLCLLTAHLFLVFAEQWEATGRGYRWLYAAGAALGLTVLTKYNGVLLGVGIAAFFVDPSPAAPALALAAPLSRGAAGGGDPGAGVLVEFQHRPCVLQFPSVGTLGRRRVAPPGRRHRLHPERGPRGLALPAAGADPGDPPTLA